MAVSERNIRNIFIYVIPNFIGYGLNLLTLPIITRILSPAEFGVVVMAGLAPAVAVGILTLGLVGATERNYFEVRKDKTMLDSLIISTQVFLYVMLAISSACIFLSRGFLSKIFLGNESYGNAVFVSYLALFLAYIVSFYQNIYKNMEKAKEYVINVIMQNILMAFFTLLFVWYFRLSYMGPLLGSFVAGAVISVWMLLRFNADYMIKNDLNMLKKNIMYGLQLVPKSFTGLTDRFFDKYMLLNTLSISAVGIYNIGQNIGNLLFGLMTAVGTAFQPVFYREIFDNGSKASGTVGRLYSMFSYIMLFPVIVTILFAKEILGILAPPSYSGAVPVIIIVSSAVSMHVFGKFVGTQYAYTKKSYWLFPITIIGTTSNVLANIVLIPRFGLIGAAISYVVSCTVINMVGMAGGQKLFRVAYEWPWLTLMYADIFLSASVIIFLQSTLLPDLYIFPVKVIFFGFYLLIGFASGLLSREKINRVISMFGVEIDSIRTKMTKKLVALGLWDGFVNE